MFCVNRKRAYIGAFMVVPLLKNSLPITATETLGSRCKYMISLPISKEYTLFIVYL